jgi:hypothetical protein
MLWQKQTDIAFLYTHTCFHVCRESCRVNVHANHKHGRCTVQHKGVTHQRIHMHTQMHMHMHVMQLEHLHLRAGLGVVLGRDKRSEVVLDAQL